MLIERYHWSLAEVAQIDDAESTFVEELLAMIEAITGKNNQKAGKAGYDDFKARHKQRIASLRGNR